MDGRMTILTGAKATKALWKNRVPDGVSRPASRFRSADICTAMTVLVLAAIYSWSADAQESESPRPLQARGYQNVAPAITLQHITPVEYFRGLLGMTPAQRERALAGKSSRDKSAILGKVKEYEALPREVREARLRQTELHWDLIRLMRLDPAERAQQLKQISPLFQPMILDQLQQWDDLPVATRKALLEDGRFVQSYVTWQVRSSADLEKISRKLPAERLTFFAQKLNQVQKVPPLSESERQQMERALQTYAELPSAQRQRCVDSFAKFAAMAPAERAQFLKNAEKWEAMTRHERDLWRTLVEDLPPMPPLPTDMPPMPPGFWEARFTPPPMPR
jgi:hypothetical protein